jgi:alcohol dehydrogenase class IV
VSILLSVSALGGLWRQEADSTIAIVKAHIRKANVLFALREYTKALEALEVAREQDEAAGSKSSREIQELSFKIQSANSAERANETEQETMDRAMRDPEVAVRRLVIFFNPLGGAGSVLTRFTTDDREL